MAKAGTETTPGPSEGKAKLDKVLAELKYDKLLAGYENERKKLRFTIEKYLDAFAANDSDVGKVHMVERHIDVGDTQPVRARARFYSTKGGYQGAN
jgi:hypothetical protein